jgi:hypothetical protein
MNTIAKFIAVFLLAGCAVAAPAIGEKPTGEEVFDLLLGNAGISLKDEPGCDASSPSRNKSHISLGDLLSTNLSASYDEGNITQIKSYCDPSKFDVSDKKTIDVWDCNVDILENDKNGEFVSSTAIRFSIDLAKSRIIPGSFRCI